MRLHKVALARVARLPQKYLKGFVECEDCYCSVASDLPVVARHLHVFHHGVVPRIDAVHYVGVRHAVVGVGNIAQVFLTDQFIPIEAPGVGDEELVSGGVEQKLRQGEAVAVLEGLDDFHQLGEFGGAHPGDIAV